MPLFLDTGILGLLTNPKGHPVATACTQWLRDCIAAGATVCVPEIADYELRRELLLCNSVRALEKLNILITDIATRYVPLTTETMRCAAEYWARMRKQGTPTADQKSLDGDVILAAQANLTAVPGQPAIIVTNNVGHLARLADARSWRDVPPGIY